MIGGHSLHHHHQRPQALYLIGYERSYQIIKNKNKICVYICLYQWWQKMLNLVDVFYAFWCLLGMATI